MRVQWRSSPAWLLTIVYGSPYQAQQQVLWQELREIAQYVQGSWSIASDFNAVIHQHERRGAESATQPRGAQAFKSCI